MLESLSDHNQKALELHRFLTGPRSNGIACPKCGAELEDVPGKMLTSMPPQIPVRCPRCGYMGSRY